MWKCSGVADWNFMRPGIMHLRKSLWWALMCQWIRHCCMKSVEFIKSDFRRNQSVELEFSAVDISSCYAVPFSVSCSVFTFILSGNWRPVISLSVYFCASLLSLCGLERYVSNSNPVLGSSCPLQAQCQQLDFDVKPQFIPLSLWTPMLSS